MLSRCHCLVRVLCHAGTTPSHTPHQLAPPFPHMAVGGDVPTTAAELFESTVVEEWHSALNLYDRVVQLLSSERARKRKQTKKKEENESLAHLDHWWVWLNPCATSCCAIQCFRYQNTLPGLVKSREPPYMTQEELCRLMKWKLTVSELVIETGSLPIILSERQIPSKAH